jgi:uncharacterized protein (TIGR00251 family)
MNPALTQTPEGVIVAVYVQPRASRDEVVGMHGDALRVRLTAPPVEGAANQRCREFFAKFLGVSKSDVTLISGDKSRHKRLLIRGVDAAAVFERLK